MNTPLLTRAGLKIKKIARELGESAEEREFRRRVFPLADAIEGWLLPLEGQWLFTAARSLAAPANIVEIGSFKGRSTYCLAFACKRTEKRVFAIDLFSGGPDLPQADSFEEFSANMKRFDVSDCVVPIVGLSTQVARNWNKPIHMLFIDGSHSYEDVLADFGGFFPHVVSGGVIVLHDVRNEAWPGVGNAWRDVISQELTDVGYCESLGYGRKPARTSPQP